MSEASEMDAKLAAEMPELKAPPMSAALSAAIANSKPVRLRRPLRDFGIFLALSLPMLGVLVAMMGVRHDVSEISPLWVGSVALVWFASYGASAYLGFVPAKGQVQPRSQNIYRIVAAASLLLISIGLFASQGGVSEHSMTYPATFSNVMAYAPRCSMMGVTAGIVPGLIALLLMRRYVPVGRLSVGLSLGAAGGSLSGLALHMHCPISESFHVGLIHGGCLVLSALFVAGASRILLRDRG